MNNRLILFASFCSLLLIGQFSFVSAQCDITINMEDTYGDGWNGASLAVYDGETQLGSATITNGFDGTATISAPDVTDIRLVWTTGDYDEEITFSVTNGIGIEVYVGEILDTPGDGEFFVFTNACSSVGLDLNLIQLLLPPRIAFGEVEITGIVRNERDTPITSFDVIYFVDGLASEVTSIENLNIAFNESFEFTHIQLANMDVGDHEINLNVININGWGEDDMPNNTFDSEVLCVNEVFRKTVVYEEGTGTWCGWCPRGLVGLNTMGHNYKDGSWIGIGVHNGDPMTVNEYDQGIGAYISGYPSGLMNRKRVFDPGLFTLELAYEKSKNEVPLGTIEIVAKTYDESTGAITVVATTNFAMDMTNTAYNLSMVILESGVTGTGSAWNQSNYYAGGAEQLTDWDGTNWANLPNNVPAVDMVYNHVARDLVNGWDGAAGIIPADVEYGTAYGHVITYTLDEQYNPDEVDIVVLLLDASTGAIVNAHELALRADILIADFSTVVMDEEYPLEVNFIDATDGGNVTAWSWDFNNDGVEDANEQNPSFTYEIEGFYSVALTVTNETENSFKIVKDVEVQSGTVSIGEIIESNFTCFPNPTQDVIHVQSVNELSSIRIFNINGQVVYADYNIASKIQTIDISSFEKGVFYIELNTEGASKTQMIIVN